MNGSTGGPSRHPVLQSSDPPFTRDALQHLERSFQETAAAAAVQTRADPQGRARQARSIM